MALIITIIILIILALISINVIYRAKEIIEKAELAKEQSLIAQYTENIKLIKYETRLNNNGELTLNNLKQAFDDVKHRNWINSTEIITDNEVEKIKLITNDGYIFYVTADEMEYIGKNDLEVIKITAEMVGFTPSDDSWTGIENVEQALDYLYNN